MENQKEIIFKSLKSLEKWIEDHHYQAYEPFDGLSSFLTIFTFKNLLLERILQQSVRRIFINIRPIIGVTIKDSTKGQGYMASGYLLMHKKTNEAVYLKKAIACLDWLDKNKSPYYEKHSWGNHFPFSSRGGSLPKLEPIIVWTSLIGQAFIDGYEITNQKEYLDIVRSICDWIISLPREKTERGSALSYVAYEVASVHNSNMLGAAMLARASRYLDDKMLIKVAKEAMEYSCSRQLPDGSWWYSEDRQYHWIDNFHTAYNLDSLKCYSECAADHDYLENLSRGLAFYKNNLFEKDGTPKYYHNKTSPIDSQCVSQSIETLVNFMDQDPEIRSLAFTVTNWAIKHMQSRKDGHFYFRKYPLGIRNTTPMLHWAQATTYKALALLYSKI